MLWTHEKQNWGPITSSYIKYNAIITALETIPHTQPLSRKHSMTDFIIYRNSTQFCGVMMDVLEEDTRKYCTRCDICHITSLSDSCGHSKMSE